MEVKQEGSTGNRFKAKSGPRPSQRSPKQNTKFATPAGASDQSSASQPLRTQSRAAGLQRVIVASATLDAARLQSYFDGAPIFRVAGRCFPVTVLHAASASSSTNLVESRRTPILLSQPAGSASRHPTSGRLNILETFNVLITCVSGYGRLPREACFLTLCQACGTSSTG